MPQGFRETIFFSSTQLPTAYHPCIDSKPEWRFPLHIHEQLELLLFHQGQVEITCGNDHFTAQAGDIVVVNSNMPHGFYTCGDFHYDCLFVQAPFLEQFGFPIKDLHFETHFRDEEITRFYERLRDVTDEFCRLNAKQPPHSRLLLAQSLALSLTALLVDRFSKPRSEVLSLDSRTELVKKVVRYVQDHLREPITLEDIGREVNFSKAYLCRVFHEYTGCTIFDTIQQMRCEHARELLMQGEHSITACAQLSGFTTPSYFAKIYRRWIGELPSESAKKAAPVRR